MARNRNKPKHKGRKGTNAALRKQAYVDSLKQQANHKKQLDAEYKTAAHESFAKAMLGMLWAVHTMEGFGRLRCMRIFLELQQFFMAFMVEPSEREGGFGGIEFREISDALYEEVGIRIDPITAEYDMDEQALALFTRLKEEYK